MDTTEKLLKELSETRAIGGNEGPVARIMQRELGDFTGISSDKLGSFIACKEGKKDGPKIMLAGHMDEIGFLVTKITKEGFVKFNPVGGWWGHNLLGQRVVIRTRKGEVLGVVGSKPPHILKAEEQKKVMDLEDMYIDVGATDRFDPVKKLGIRPGDPVTPEASFAVMGNKKLYLGKAWDNRVGVALVIEVLKKLRNVKHPNIVYGVGTVQEELGLRGAGTAAFQVDPDVGFALDVNIARDIPGCGEAAERLGGGASVCVMDSSLMPNTRLRDLVIDTAEAKKIPFHYSSVSRGGTDAGRIHMTRMGVPSIFVGVATRYIHGHNGIFCRDDFNAVVRLMVETIKKLDRKTVDGLARW